MADLGAFRKASRAVLNESATVRRAVHAYVLPEISTGRYHYIRDLFDSGGDINGDAPDEGPSGGTWAATNLTKTSGLLVAASSFAAIGTGSIDSGFSDGYLSYLHFTSATAGTDHPMSVGFRMATTGWSTPSNTPIPTSGWAVAVTNTNVDLYKNAGVVATAVHGVSTTSSCIPVEVRLNGSNIQVWVNGVRLINHTDTTHQAATIIGVGIHGGGVGFSNPPGLDDLFFASVPTCPLGVVRDGDGGNYVSTAVPMDAGVAAGALIPAHVRWAALGATVSTDPNTVQCGLVDDNGTQIKAPVAEGFTAADNGYRGPATWNHYATDTGLNTGAARVGTFRLRTRLLQTAGLAATQYTLDSEDIGNSPPSGTAGSTVDYGRGYASVPVAAASVQKPSTLQAYADVATEGVTLATQPWRAGAVPTIQPRQGNVNVPSKGGSGGNWSGGASSRTDTIDKNFTRASAGVQLLITMPSAPAALNSEPAILLNGSAPTGFALTTQPTGESNYTRLDSGTDDDAWTADPRLTVYHLLLLNDNTYATPPTSEDTIPKNRLVSDLGFVAARVRNANGVGQNGITWTRSLRDANSLVAEVFGDSVTTATAGGEAGWDPALGAWSSSLPGGGWFHKRTITAPSGAIGADMLLNSQETFTLLAPNPAYRVLAAGGASGLTADKDHWHPGDPLLVGLVLVNTVTGKAIAPDSGTAAMYIGRFNQTLGRADYLDSDLTWKQISTSTPAYAWPLSPSAGDANVFVALFADTSGFSTEDLHLVGYVEENSTPYSGPAYVPVLDQSNRHDKVVFDGVDFATGFSFK